jgi:hypothetical protein
VDTSFIRQQRRWSGRAPPRASRGRAIARTNFAAVPAGHRRPGSEGQLVVTRPEHFSGQAGLQKNSAISGRKNPAHDHPTGRIGPQFSSRARAGPGLGRAARAFYSVKQLKTTFRTGLGSKKTAGFKISTHTRPVKSVGGSDADRTGPDSKCSGIVATVAGSGSRGAGGLLLAPPSRATPRPAVGRGSPARRNPTSADLRSRPEHFSGRAEKISVISGPKNPSHDHPTGRIGPQFSGRARAWAGRPRIL